MKKKTKKKRYRKFIWVTAQLYCEIFFFFYCIVREKAGNFFLLQLYCKRRATVLQYVVDWPGIVLQYLYCIAT